MSCSQLTVSNWPIQEMLMLSHNFWQQAHIKSTSWDRFTTSSNLPMNAVLKNTQKKCEIRYKKCEPPFFTGQKFLVLLSLLSPSCLWSKLHSSTSAMRDRRGSMDDAFSPFVSMPSVVDLNAGKLGKHGGCLFPHIFWGNCGWLPGEIKFGHSFPEVKKNHAKSFLRPRRVTGAKNIYLARKGFKSFFEGKVYQGNPSYPPQSYPPQK